MYTSFSVDLLVQQVGRGFFSLLWYWVDQITQQKAGKLVYIRSAQNTANDADVQRIGGMYSLANDMHDPCGITFPIHIHANGIRMLDC